MGKCPYSAWHRFIKPAQKQGAAEWFGEAHEMQVTIALEGEPELREQLRMIQLTEQDLQLLRTISPLVQQHLESITMSFYNSVTNVPKLKAIITEHSSIERLKQTLKEHISEMFDGQIDEAFIRKRLQIAHIHQKVGLEPKWYLSAFQNLQDGLLDVLQQYITAPEERIMIGKAVGKLLSFEQQLVLEAYEMQNLSERQKQYEAVKEELKGKMAAVSKELAILTEKTNASVQELVASSGEVNHSFLNSAAKSKESASHAMTGYKQMKDLEQVIDLIKTSTFKMDKSVNELNSAFKEMESIVGMVRDIAGQTKLLSLNAAIEAARAGEKGKGFGIVAAEVQKLSEDTRGAAGQITDYIYRSNALVVQVVSTIQEVRRSVLQGEAETEKTSDMLWQIKGSMDASLTEINRVESEMEQLVTHIDQIGSAISQVAVSAEHLKNAAIDI